MHRASRRDSRCPNGLFDPDELGHPNSLFEDLAPTFAPQLCHPGIGQPIMNVQYITAPPPPPRPSKVVVFSTGKIELQPTK